MKINTKINLLRIFFYLEFIIFFIIGYINPEGAIALVLVIAVAGVAGFLAGGVASYVAVTLGVASIVASYVAFAGAVAVGFVAGALTIFVIEDTLKMIRLKEEEAHNEN